MKAPNRYLIRLIRTPAEHKRLQKPLFVQGRGYELNELNELRGVAHFSPSERFDTGGVFGEKIAGHLVGTVLFYIPPRLLAKGPAPSTSQPGAAAAPCPWGSWISGGSLHEDVGPVIQIAAATRVAELSAFCP